MSNYWLTNQFFNIILMIILGSILAVNLQGQVFRFNIALLWRYCRCIVAIEFSQTLLISILQRVFL